MKTFALIQDPGHGWLRVPKAEFDAMSISDKISDCSYQSDKYVFLEEDVDMGIFMEARETRGIVTKVKPYQNKSRESKIRKYPSYKPAVLTVG